jgi:hypothetical protein
MNDRLTVSGRLRPYLILSITGILAFMPVSFMMLALKNDIINLEYPINFFLSQSIRHGEPPLWFNTWGMGFPLYSGLTWGIYSTPQLVFSALFDYNVYILHLEFMFFILLAGWSMFYLLRKHFGTDEKVAIILAASYMLSGFMVGSSQWLLYISAAAFIPMMISCVLSLLKKPGFSTAAQFAAVYTIMFTSSYAAFNIITTYGLVIFIVAYLLLNRNLIIFKSLIPWLGLTALMTCLLIFPCVYSTVEVLQYMKRGKAIDGNEIFFNSNYCPPEALSTMLLPFSAVRQHYFNTEGTMFHLYAGLFTLMLLPTSILKSIREKNRLAWGILGIAILFLMLSFGDKTPLRDYFNLLPGFSYFRNPGVFRLFFIVFILLFLAINYRSISLGSLIKPSTGIYRKMINATCIIMVLILGTTMMVHSGGLKELVSSGIVSTIKKISLSQTLFLSALIQVLLLAMGLLFARRKQATLLFCVALADLIVNTAICTPYFSVGSYSIPEVHAVYRPTPGFPVQDARLNEVPAMIRDVKGNPWNNVNVFSKQVSSGETYRGPLTLESFYQYVDDSSLPTNRSLVYTQSDHTENKVRITIQKPGHMQVIANFQRPDSLTLLQNYFPGWKVYLNGRTGSLSYTEKTGITTLVGAGETVIDFRYQRNTILISAIIVHLLILIFLVTRSYYFLKRFKT